MNFNKLKESVDNIIEKYYKEDDECFIRYRYDASEKEHQMDNEIMEFLDKNNITYQISYKDGFNSCRFSEDFLAVAFITDNRLYLKTVLFKYM